MEAGAQGQGCGGGERTVLLVAPALPSLPRQRPGKSLGLSLSFLICEMREIAMTSQVLNEVGYVGSFSEILRKIILLQKTLQNK